jgi:hypothetical protein
LIGDVFHGCCGVRLLGGFVEDFVDEL